MAEIEWIALTTECLDWRIPDEKTLRDEVTAWHREWNYPDTAIE